MAVIGRDEGKFVDNAKFFLLQGMPLLAPTVRVVFITERKEVAKIFEGTGCQALIYPSLPAVWHLLRSGTLVVDSIEWTRRMRRFFAMGAKVLQLWHGVGFKRIELDKWRNEVARSHALSSASMLALRRTMHRFTGRLVRYDAVNTTSTFYRDNVFVPAFLSRHFLVTGYPRNTFGKLDGVAHSLAWRNVDASIAELLPHWMNTERRFVLVMPTFRDSRATPMGLTADVVSMLDDYCDLSGVELVFKFHPLEQRTTEIKGRHLHLCRPDSDLYPLMPSSSALVTDYSSIYMDYLLLDKPIVFLVPDLDQYVREDRPLQFDFSRMTPGPKVGTWDELVTVLSKQWTHDDYSQERAALRQLAFDDLPQDQSVPKLIAFMRQQLWLPGEFGKGTSP